MIDKDLKALLQKAEELRALFVLGQRVIPFLEEIFIFVGEIKPLLDEINHSIDENIQKMPKASKQISKVTEATENATNEIMDTLDGMAFKTNIMGADLKKIRGLTANLQAFPQGEFDALMENCEKVLESVQGDSNTIMLALQVQDITSQQLAAVNNILQTIQQKLARILHHFRSPEMNDLISSKNGVEKENSPTNVSMLHRTIAFDPDAVDAFALDKDRQKAVDELIQNLEAQPLEVSVENKSEHGESAPDNAADDFSQDDIDSLFKKNGISNAAPEGPVEETGDTDEISQDDIDALFR